MSDAFADPRSLKIIGLDTEDGILHPLYDERIKLPLDEALITSILLYGVRVPVLVREEGGVLYVVDGRQRVRAAREAAERDPDIKVKVPVSLQIGDDRRLSSVMTLVNEHRKDDPILTKARKALRVMERVGNVDEVAVVFGKTAQTIRNWLSLMEADPQIHDAIEAGYISASAGVELSRLDRQAQGPALEELLKAARAEQGQDPGKSAALNAALDRQVSEADVKKKRKESGDSKSQAGIKRTWLRKALKTKAAESLDDEQRGVLEWFVNGTTDDKNAWYDTFWFDASGELGDE